MGCRGVLLPAGGGGAEQGKAAAGSVESGVTEFEIRLLGQRDEYNCCWLTHSPTHSHLHASCAHSSRAMLAASCRGWMAATPTGSTSTESLSATTTSTASGGCWVVFVRMFGVLVVTAVMGAHRKGRSQKRRSCPGSAPYATAAAVSPCGRMRARMPSTAPIRTWWKHPTYMLSLQG